MALQMQVGLGCSLMDLCVVERVEWINECEIVSIDKTENHDCISQARSKKKGEGGGKWMFKVSSKIYARHVLNKREIVQTREFFDGNNVVKHCAKTLLLM